MAKRLFVLVCVLLSATALSADQHIIRFAGEAPNNFTQLVTDAGGAVAARHDGAGFALVSGLDDAGAAALANAAGAAEAIRDVEFYVQPGDMTLSETIAPASPSNPTLATFYARQWHLRAIGADVAWSAGRLGSPDVTVAVIDTGVSYTHADLAGRVDLTRSVSFVPSDDAFVAMQFPGFHPVTDLHFHGTHVASTIASNAVVGAGVTSRVTLIGIKVISRLGVGSLGGVLSGLLWAADHGADVANISLGAFMDKTGAGRDVAMIQQAFNYAHRKGTLVVVAAGNEATDLDHDGNRMKLFCGAANVVCVSATAPTSGGINGPWTNVDTFAGYSNYGRSSIDVAAPGGSGAGFVWAACSRTSGFSACRANDLLISSSGTSMAAPHVAGLAALLVEDIGHGRPSQVKARLLQTAQDLGQRGTDPLYGKGRIHIPRALGLQ